MALSANIDLVYTQLGPKGAPTSVGEFQDGIYLPTASIAIVKQIVTVC